MDNASCLFQARGLEGPALNLFSHGVRGKDFVSITKAEVVADLRMSKIAAHNVVEEREQYLSSSMS